ncbi:MAG: hypothetical protein JXQ71_01085 [Verrucomicrobia bacterium]|nr:hypothetical protein [Verrucomicrobiota bacterium]
MAGCRRPRRTVPAPDDPRKNCTLEELDRRGIVSDQYLSDFMADVIRHSAGYDVFTRFSNSIAKLAYHFHPSADVTLRTDRIRNLANC